MPYDCWRRSSKIDIVLQNLTKTRDFLNKDKVVIAIFIQYQLAKYKIMMQSK